MTGESITGDPALPVEGAIEDLFSVEDMWEAFANVPGWPDWNPCMAWARVTGGELKEGATLYWALSQSGGAICTECRRSPRSSNASRSER